MKAKIIHGENKNKIGTVKSVLWGANLAIIELSDGKEIAVKPVDINVIDD